MPLHCARSMFFCLTGPSFCCLLGLVRKASWSVAVIGAAANKKRIKEEEKENQGFFYLLSVLINDWLKAWLACKKAKTLLSGAVAGHALPEQ